MLDIGLLEQILLDLAVARRVEDLFLDLGVDPELQADLLGELLLLPSPLAFSNFANSSSTLRWSALSSATASCVFVSAMINISYLGIMLRQPPVAGGFVPHRERLSIY